jgi:hypothetical protein
MAGDISYIRTSEGWLYLTIILDLYSHRVIGWAIGNQMKQDLAIWICSGIATTTRRVHSPYRLWVAILFQRVPEAPVQAWLKGLDERQEKLL